MDSNLDKIKKILILLRYVSKESDVSKYFARMASLFIGVMARLCRIKKLSGFSIISSIYGSNVTELFCIFYLL